MLNVTFTNNASKARQSTSESNTTSLYYFVCRKQSKSFLFTLFSHRNNMTHISRERLAECEALAVPPTRNSKARHETSRLDALDRVSQLQSEASLVEKELDISERWAPEHPRWEVCMKTAAELKYDQALNKLEGLVVQRLAELKKAHMARTGTFLTIQSLPHELTPPLRL
jgi:hypothetical protein